MEVNMRQKEKKLYSVLMCKVALDGDISEIKKDYSIMENASLVGMKKFCMLIVYEEDGIFKELISGIQVPVMEERQYEGKKVYIPEYPNAQEYVYKYRLVGDYPIFFLINRHCDMTTVFNAPKLDDLEVDDKYLNYYIDFIENEYAGKNPSDYKINWYNFLKNQFEETLLEYGEVIENSDYSNAYIEKYGNPKQKIKD